MLPSLRTNHADRFCGLSPMQACRHANRHTGRKADGHDCGQAEGVLGRRAAALRLRESPRNMKASAVCYNFRHIPFDVSATLCLNDAPDAGRISDAFTTASLDLGLPAVHRLPQRHERAPGVGARGIEYRLWRRHFMQVITIVQTKGGSGKTTTAMLLASAALNLGRRVTLIDGDVNAQLGRWRDSFELAAWEGAQKPDWPESLAILSPPESVEGLLTLLEAEEARGVDLVVIDTRPGTHTDTEDFCLISDLVLIPARPVYAEWEITHRAVLWMDDLRASIAEGERFPAVRVLVMDAGPKIIDAATREGGMAQLPKRDQDVLQEILRLDHLDVIVPHSRILEQLGYHGPLGPAARANAKAPGGRLLADTITRQLEVAELVLTGIDEVIPA